MQKMEVILHVSEIGQPQSSGKTEVGGGGGIGSMCRSHNGEGSDRESELCLIRSCKKQCFHWQPSIFGEEKGERKKVSSLLGTIGIICCCFLSNKAPINPDFFTFQKCPQFCGIFMQIESEKIEDFLTDLRVPPISNAAKKFPEIPKTFYFQSVDFRVKSRRWIDWLKKGRKEKWVRQFSESITMKRVEGEKKVYYSNQGLSSSSSFITQPCLVVTVDEKEMREWPAWIGLAACEHRNPFTFYLFLFSQLFYSSSLKNFVEKLLYLKNMSLWECCGESGAAQCWWREGHRWWMIEWFRRVFTQTSHRSFS